MKDSLGLMNKAGFSLKENGASPSRDAHWNLPLDKPKVLILDTQNPHR